jgi:hypothetical protein
MAVLFSYIYLAFLIIPRQDCLTSSCTPVENPTTQQWALLIVVMIFYTLAFYAPAVMLASFLLLRRSMSRVTSLPDEYLDEREIANRDWAFKTGYLVVRRVGLALALLFLVLRIIGYAPGYGQFVKDSDTVLFVKQFNNYLLSLTGNHTNMLTDSTPVAFYFNLIALLTYVAYSFPLILVAWRESKFPEALPTTITQRIKISYPSAISKYFRRVSIVGSIIVAYFLLMFLAVFIRPIGEFLAFSGALFYLIFAGVGYAMFVYVWASIKTVELLKQKDNAKQFSVAKLAALIFFILTQIVGVSLLVAIFNLSSSSGQDNPLMIIFALGLLMIPLQILSFVFLRLMTQHSTEDSQSVEQDNS